MKRICTLHDAWVSWCSGEKFPIAFFGDSTTDGNTTTGYERNQFGKDSLNPNAYCKILEDRLREATEVGGRKGCIKAITGNKV